MAAVPADPEAGGVKETLARITERVATASQANNRDRPARLVAVSKMQANEKLMAAYETGHRHFGENYIQEFVAKAKTLPKDIQWHFIGHLQTNKCKLIADIPNLFLVETIHSKKLATQLNNAFTKAGREDKVGVLVQVNTSGEENKHGIGPQDIKDIVDHVREACPRLELRGVMCIGMNHREDAGPNPDFVALAKVREDMAQRLGVTADALELSMGMSADYEEGIRLGSTNVRVGSSIFGQRPAKTSLA